jgi:hypothetical protein
LFASLAVATACGYSPNISPGTLRCGSGDSCPEGFACGTGSLCWKQSDTPEPGTQRCGAGSTCPTNYVCGPGNACWRSATNPNSFIGCWIFDPNSIQQIDCTDDSSDTLDLSTVGDFVELTVGTTSPLATEYYCPLRLLLPGQSTALAPGDQDCTLVDTSTYDEFIHHPEKFAFSTTDGAKATFELSLPFEFSGPTLGEGRCTLRTTGTLTKGVAGVTCPPPLAAQSRSKR